MHHRGASWQIGQQYRVETVCASAVLRLRVVKMDGNYDEYFAPVKIAN